MGREVVQEQETIAVDVVGEDVARGREAVVGRPETCGDTVCGVQDAAECGVWCFSEGGEGYGWERGRGATGGFERVANGGVCGWVVKNSLLNNNRVP